MFKIKKKSYIVIEVSKNKNRLIPTIALGLGMSNTQAVVIFSLDKKNIKIFKKVLTPWSKRNSKDRGVLFLYEKCTGSHRDLLSLANACKKSFPKGVTIVVDDYHLLLKNTHRSRKKYLDMPEALERIAVKHKGLLALFSDSTNCIECPVCLCV